MEFPPPLPLDNSRVRSIVICAIIFPTIATLCVIGRFFSRRIKKSSIGADDWAILGALIALYGQMVIIILSAFYGGVGHHITDLSGENIAMFFKLVTAVQFTFGTSLGLVKISICLLLMRIFSVRSFRVASLCVMIYCICWMIMVISIGAGLCRPFAFNWDKTIEGGVCGALDPAYISIAALDIVGDVMIIVLPMPWVWNLQTSRANKIGLTVVLALGLLDIIVSILRIVYLINTDFVTPGADFTWESTGTYVWSVIEPSLGVIVACVAVLRPLFVQIFPNLNTFSRRYATGINSYSSKAKRETNNYSNITRDDEYPLQPVGDGQSAQKGTRSEIRVDNEFTVNSRPENET